MFDSILVLGTIPSNLGDPSSPFLKDMISKINEIIHETADLNILIIAVEALSESAFYCHSCFRVHALSTIESLNSVARKVRKYWDSKKGKPFYKFD